ncbi:MAG TPA: low molecular weight phosphatase family protein [Catenuloplanes sp.]|jgi:protein-tyrosine phosphatase
MTDDRFAVLVVCHANLCRSPMAERLARQTIADRLGPDAASFEVVSAGTHAWTGRPMHPLAAEVLREHGVDDSGFSSQRLTASLVRRADLVLTATRRQRAECVAMVPAAVRRTFTLPQFGRLASAVAPYSLTAIWPPQARLRSMLDELLVIRGELPVPPVEQDELPDPVDHPIGVFRRCAGEIQSVFNVMTGLIEPI